MKKQSSPYHNQARGPALVLEVPDFVKARQIAKQTPPAILPADDIVPLTEWAEYKDRLAADGLALVFTGRFDLQGRAVFAVTGAGPARDGGEE